VNLVFANREEATALSGLQDAAQSLAYIAGMTDTAIVKMGKMGASAMHRGGERVVVPANKIENVIDTTAAGDYFAAGFLYAYGNGAALEDCLDLGVVLSESIIQVVGTRLSDEAWEKNRRIADLKIERFKDLRI
jgi:sugar/nucleoside kinase (ribokinase family)